jgi:hypothetical protein
MELFRNFRLARGKSALRKRISKLKRIKFKGNIGTAKKIGIVWDAANPSDFSVIAQFHQRMFEKNIDVSVIAYYPGKELPDKLTAIRYLTCLKPQDISITFRPVAAEASSFINIRFDILIDANFRSIFPLQYISSLSLAGFKVGIFDHGYEHSPFDMMIETGRNFDLGNYLNQTVHYLEMINTGNQAQKA